MELKRLVAPVALAAVAVLAGGCAVYSTPSGDVIGPAPLVVSPPAVVISPWGYGRGYWGGPRYYGGHRYYPGPRYPSPRGQGPYYRYR